MYRFVARPVPPATCWLRRCAFFAALALTGLMVMATGTARTADPAPWVADAEGFVPLLAGEGFAGWYKLLDQHEKNDDPDGIIHVEDGVVHMYKDAEAGSVQPYGSLETEAEYGDYDLRLEYKWGEKEFAPPRPAMKRDAGILYHCFGPDGLIGPWPRSNEFQIQETDTGDITGVLIQYATTVDPATSGDGGLTSPAKFLEAADGGVGRTYGGVKKLTSISKRGNFEVDGWNTIELQVRGDSAAYLVNGHVVNRCTEMRRPAEGDLDALIPLTKGKILIQAEGAEVFYRNIRIRPAKAVAQKPAAPALRAGAAAANFAADDKMQIAGGIDPSYAHGQEGELRAVATVVEQPGSGKFAIVACDVLFVTREMIDRVAAILEKSCGIPPAHLLVNATHTHHAPATVRIHGCHAEPEFVRSVEAGIVQAVEQANARLTDDCRFLFHLGEEPAIGMNSRTLLADGMINWIGSTVPTIRPTGPFDPQLPVWSFRGPDDKLVSVIYNHSTHTIGTLKGGVRSPSFYGLAAQALGEKWGVPVCFLEGASGSTHNMNCSVPDAIAKLERDVTEGVDQATPRPVNRIVAIKRPFRFKVRTFDEATEDKKVSDYCSKHAPGALDMCLRVFRQSRLEMKPEQGKERETFNQVILIGDVALVGVSAEFFTGLGMEIKKRSPFKETYVAELANDWIGYLPDREAHQLGGYQTWMGSHSFAEVGTGERVVDHAVSMLEELAAQTTTDNKQ